MTTKVALTSDDLHWFDDAFRAWENNDFVGVLNGLNAAVSHFVGTPPAIEEPKRRDREADRQRFTDPAFNRWLDDGISDSGHTVWDQIGSVVDAWAGWENREHYTADGHALGVDVPQGQEKDRG